MSAAAECKVLSEFFKDEKTDRPCEILDLEGCTPFDIKEHCLDDRGSFFDVFSSLAYSETADSICSAAALHEVRQYSSALKSAQTSDANVSIGFPLQALAHFIVYLHLHHEPQKTFLVFVPGIQDTRELEWWLDDLMPYDDMQIDGLFQDSWRVILLHSRVQIEIQQAAILGAAPSTKRKILIATDVIESSVTIPECAVVLDTCLHTRQRLVTTLTGARHAHLQMGLITKDEAIQRMGRTGRTCKGEIYRLVSRATFSRLNPHPTPEICRANIAGILLLLQQGRQGYCNLGDPRDFLKFKVPTAPESRAIDETGQVTRHNAVQFMHVDPKTSTRARTHTRNATEDPRDWSSERFTWKYRPL